MKPATAILGGVVWAGCLFSTTSAEADAPAKPMLRGQTGQRLSNIAPGAVQRAEYEREMATYQLERRRYRQQQTGTRTTAEPARNSSTRSNTYLPKKSNPDRVYSDTGRWETDRSGRTYWHARD